MQVGKTYHNGQGATRTVTKFESPDWISYTGAKIRPTLLLPDPAGTGSCGNRAFAQWMGETGGLYISPLVASTLANNARIAIATIASGQLDELLDDLEEAEGLRGAPRKTVLAAIASRKSDL